jgi:hypothetical protein
MTKVKKLILDILKPHQPNALEFASALAEQASDIQVTLNVVAVDEKTESVVAEIEGENINFERLTAHIKELGASVHSIDEVQVVSSHKPEKTPEDK